VSGLRPLDEAISTAGGVAWEELDEHLMLRQRPGTFVAGEMLDWEAPTGGYLLQGCFSTGAWVARGVTTIL
jgi:predicted flavoprotein YhiN